MNQKNTKPTKIPVTQITITRVEGLHSECMTTTHLTWTEAERQIKQICKSAPKTGGYHKCQFQVVFANSEMYEGRYCAAHPASQAYEGRLGKHIRDHLLFCSGLRKPNHMGNEEYARFIDKLNEQSPGTSEFSRQMLTSYALTDKPASPKADALVTPEAPPGKNDTISMANMMEESTSSPLSLEGPSVSAPTSKPADRKSSRQMRDENVAFAMTNHLQFIPVLGRTYALRKLYYVWGGRWDPKAKQWLLPSHRHAEAQAAADRHTQIDTSAQLENFKSDKPSHTQSSHARPVSENPDDVVAYEPHAGSCPNSDVDVRPIVKTPEIAAEILFPCFRCGEQPKMIEELWLILLDAGCRMVDEPLMLSKGDVDGCDVPIRAMLRAVLSKPLAVSFIVSHNHPTGHREASSADIAVTTRISKAAQSCDLTLSDHVIIAGKGWTSIRRERADAFT